MRKNAGVPRSDVLPTNQPQLYSALLHQVRAHTARRYKAEGPPTNLTQLYRALLDDISFTWVRMQMYPGQMYPPLINPSCTGPYYTRSV